MRSLMRSLALGSVLAATLVPAASLAAQAADPFTGTWKLNVTKSKYDPGPPPKSSTVTFEAAGKGIKVTAKGVDAQGSPTSTQYTANFDGKDYPITGAPDYDMVALKRIDASTVETTRKKAGKVVQTATRTVSKDGKVITIVTKGTNGKGQTINNTAVFDKQ